MSERNYKDFLIALVDDNGVGESSDISRLTPRLPAAPGMDTKGTIYSSSRSRAASIACSNLGGFVRRLFVDAQRAHQERFIRARIRRLVQEGRYVAKVDVELLEDETGWSPYLSPEDAYKLDDVRNALRRGDIRSASNLARVFELRPVASE
jgi:hypothetical protein